MDWLVSQFKIGMARTAWFFEASKVRRARRGLHGGLRRLGRCGFRYLPRCPMDRAAAKRAGSPYGPG
jgi:hypothetical protein